VACRTEADEVRRLVRATRSPGENVVHVGAIAFKVAAALNTAMPVATQHLESHLLPFQVGCDLVPHWVRKLCMASVHAVKGRGTPPSPARARPWRTG
jgi:hypothetical protein